MRRTTIVGTGNVFADLGVPNADEHLAEANLASKIASVIEARGLAQVEAARIIGLPEVKVSRRPPGRFRAFSAESLGRLLDRLGVTGGALPER